MCSIEIGIKKEYPILKMLYSLNTSEMIHQILDGSLRKGWMCLVPTFAVVEHISQPQMVPITENLVNDGCIIDREVWSESCEIVTQARMQASIVYV